jgi:hypothetical protein
MTLDMFFRKYPESPESLKEMDDKAREQMAQRIAAKTPARQINQSINVAQAEVRLIKEGSYKMDAAEKRLALANYQVIIEIEKEAIAIRGGLKSYITA